MCKIKCMQSASWAIKKVFKFKEPEKAREAVLNWAKQIPQWVRWTPMDSVGFSELLWKGLFFPQNIKSRDLQPEAELVKPDSSALLCCARQSLMLQTSRPLHCCSPSAFTVCKPNQKHQAAIHWYMIHHFQVQKALSGKLWAHYDLRVFPLKFKFKVSISYNKRGGLLVHLPNQCAN